MQATKNNTGEFTHSDMMIGLGIGAIMIWKIWKPIYYWYLGIIFVVAAALYIWWKRPKNLFKKSEDSVFCGKNQHRQDIWISSKQRSMHTQIVGTTNAGKTESVILPWAIQDIQSGKGLLLIDGKADNSLLDKLWTYAVQAGREKDFKLFSLSHIDESHQFNPLIGGTAEEITERVFNSFEFENPHYRSIQYEVIVQVMRIFEAANEVPTFKKVHTAILNTDYLDKIVKKVKNPELLRWIAYYKKLSITERENRTSGLLAALSHFAYGKTAELFNAMKESFTLDDALEKNLIVYFQLPALLSPFLGQATGKLVLQSLQAAIANRHRKSGEKKFFSVFLDDFSEYLYPGFVTILNKSRSANVGIVFAHQALGDIKSLGEPIANAILTNSNVKIFMRGNDPDSAEYFSKVIGTASSTKYTERQKRGIFANHKSGDVSARDVEEFVVHPNVFKRELGVGEALMVIPNEKGSHNLRMKFKMMPNLPHQLLPKIAKEKVEPILIDATTKKEKIKESEIEVELA